MNIGDANTLVAHLLLEELRRLGVAHCIVSPGSRSTPLTLAAAGNEGVRKTVHFDERGAAFYALGIARATGRPTALICTSGTAVANYLPAVVEASNDELPLILLTADRPPELQNCGANQTITQPGVFGAFVRHELNLPCPDDMADYRRLLEQLDHAWLASMSLPRGPIHINCPFREPLVAESLGIAPIPSLEDWYASREPLTDAVPHAEPVPDDVIAGLAVRLNAAHRGVLVVGRLSNEAERAVVGWAIRQLGWPVFADVTSGLNAFDDDRLIPHYDVLLNSPEFAAAHEIDTVLHLGGRFVSKRLLQFIEASRPPTYVQAHYSTNRIDPAHGVTHFITGDLVDFCQRLIPRLSVSVDHLSAWRQRAMVADETIERLGLSTRETTEIAVARELVRLLPEDTALWAASSMPIRLLDMYAPVTGRTLATGANRGASGIDGTLASACGFALGLEQPVALMIGDLALLHDLNSLALAAKSPYPVTIIALNNNGGRIFEHLPIAEQDDILDEFFVASHGCTFEHAARMFDLPYARVETMADFAAVCTAALASREPSVIEVTLDPLLNRAYHRQMRDALSDRLGEM